ncbi:MAG: dihydrofolate reductase [Melioribacteraceae bacterium]|nr:dihydrofolate reductase [Melioribacteraceae bacterium]
MIEKIIIAAVSKNGIIGKDGKIPWKSEAELTHFKKLTMGFPIIMGRKTHDSIGKVLPGRLNIVLTKHELKSKNEKVKSFSKLNDAFLFCVDQKFEKVFIIGGRKVYEEAMSFSDKIILSEMDLFADGNVYFPEITNNWILVSEEKKIGFTIKNYIRVND